MVSTASGTNTTDAVNAVLRLGSTIDDAGFAVLYRHYQPLLTKYAARRGLFDPEGAADLAMFGGYKALKKGGFLERPEPAFRTYIYRAVDTQLADEHRRIRPTLTDLDDDLPAEVDHADDATDRLWLQSLIDELTDAQRDTIRNRFLLDLDAREVGRLLDKDPNAIHQLQHRALNRLRKLIVTLAVVVAVLVGVLVIRNVLTTELSIDTTPIDRSDSPVPTTPQLEEDRVIAPAPGDIERLDEADDNAPLAPDPRADAPTTITAPTVSSEPIADADSSPDQSTTPTAPPETSPLQNADQQATPSVTTPTAATTTLSLPPDVMIFTPLNRCEPAQLDDEITSFRLYLVENDIVASLFTKPSEVRFIDATGSVLHTIDTSGQMTNGRRPDTHGWLATDDPTSTHASYAETPRPTSWGVLVRNDEIAGWTTIEYRMPDATAWVDVTACSLR